MYYVANSSKSREAYSSEVCSEEALLDTRPECERNDEDLVWLLHVLEGGYQELDTSQLFPTIFSVVFAESTI